MPLSESGHPPPGTDPCRWPGCPDSSGESSPASVLSFVLVSPREREGLSGRANTLVFVPFLAFCVFHQSPWRLCFLRAGQHLPHLSQALHAPSSPRQSTGRDIARTWVQVSAHLGHGEDEVHGRVLRVDAFQLHARSEAILSMSDCLVLSMHRLERTQPPSSLILA